MGARRVRTPYFYPESYRKKMENCGWPIHPGRRSREAYGWWRVRGAGPSAAVPHRVGRGGIVGFFPGKPSPRQQAGAEPERLTREASSEDLRRQRVEAVLLLSRGPVPSRKLAQLAGLADATEARTLVRQINQIYAERGRAFRAEEVAGGFQLMTRPQLAPWLRRLGHIPKTIQLTPPAMETMAIVAYRQPVLRADIEAIRGVSCGEILRQLMERDLVRISGRSDELGRPYLYSTTRRFLQIFGLRDPDALPALDEPEPDNFEDPDWSDADASTDPNADQHPDSVTGAPEEESDVSTAVADLVEDNPEYETDAYVELSDPVTAIPVAAADDEDEDDEVFVDDEDDEDEDFDDEDWDDDEAEDLDDEEEDVEDVDAEWEEVDDEWEDDEDEDDEEADEEDAEDLDEEEEDEDWEDEDDDLVDDDDDEEEWD